jgi:hypothetical protein
MSRRAKKESGTVAEAVAAATDATEPTSATADTPDTPARVSAAPLPDPADSVARASAAASESAAPLAAVAAEPGSSTTLSDNAEATMALSSSTPTGSLPFGTFRVQVVLDVSDSRAMFLPMQNVTLSIPGSNAPLTWTIGPTVLHGTVPPNLESDATTDAGAVSEGLEPANNTSAAEAMPPEESDPVTNSSASARQEDVSARQSTTSRAQPRKRRKQG